MQYFFIWSGLGFLGVAIMVAKSATLGRTMAGMVLMLPLVAVFGPLFLLIGLSVRSQKLCQHCRSIIDIDAAVCPKCTRNIDVESRRTTGQLVD